MSNIRDLKVSCSCGSATHTFTIPISKLPIPTHLCSCDTSRRISGFLLTSYINITHGQSARNPELSNLTPYHSSDKLSRYFCPTCETHMYLEYHEDGHFEAATGTLQADITEGIVQYKSCMWIKDTKDGGASDWLTSIAGQSLKKWNQGAEEGDILPLDYYSSSKKVVESSRKPTHAHCHCKSVEFWVTPPNTASETARSNFSDLITPYHLGETASENPSDVPWWLCDENNRFLAGTCACISCRCASGFDITFWAFIPTCNIFLDASLTRPFPPHGLGHTNDYWGSMKVHASSKGVNRTFCGKCGATVFWDGGKEKGRYGLIDVAVGLLDAGSGARAEELLSWWKRRVSFEEFAVNKSLVRGLSEGLDDWERREGDRGVAVAR